MSTFRSTLRSYRALHTRAVDNGLKAAAQVVVNRVKANLAGGYTSGDFTHGIVMNSVVRGEPFDDVASGRSIRIGTNVKYALYWELGHNNVFTRHYERVEKWRPAFSDTRDEQREAFANGFRKTISGGGALSSETHADAHHDAGGAE